VEHLRARCPACQKLYQVETSSIYSQTPYFECKACQNVFAFEYPPTHSSSNYQAHSDVEVKTFLVHAAEPQITPEEKPPVFLQAQPSLVQLWNQIFEDYDDHERHEDFVKRCVELEALPFAKTKYQDLKGALGSDSVCEKYLGQVDALLSLKTDQKVQAEKSKNESVDLKKFGVWLRARTFKKVLYWVPLIASLILIAMGFSSGTSRNLIGVGFMVGFFGYGLIVFFNGRIHLNDFIE
jgi:hypothetical protein